MTIHQPQFMPWLGYVDKIERADLFVALDNVQFKKNEWQNRNRIRTAEGWQWLTVPVLHRFGQHVNDVRINSHAAWQAQHLRSLTMHYARAPYRDRYLGELRELYETKWDRLSELNVAVLRWLLRAFGITTPIRLASEWALREEATNRLIDICRVTGATAYLCGPGADAYMDKERFRESGVRLDVQVFRHPDYRQCYTPFVSGLSALDLLLCHGPAAREYLRETAAKAAHDTVMASRL